LTVIGCLLVLALTMTGVGYTSCGPMSPTAPHPPRCEDRRCERGKPYNVQADGQWDCFCLEQPKEKP
jgi:hypothetical protein